MAPAKHIAPPKRKAPALSPGRIAACRLDADVARMGNRALVDHPNWSRVANAALRYWLTEHGYARKGDTR